jgi:hypothetical protein
MAELTRRPEGEFVHFVHVAQVVRVQRHELRTILLAFKKHFRQKC